MTTQFNNVVFKPKQRPVDFLGITVWATYYPGFYDANDYTREGSYKRFLNANRLKEVDKPVTITHNECGCNFAPFNITSLEK